MLLFRSIRNKTILYIWIRAWGKDAKSKLILYLNKVCFLLNDFFDIKILLATNKDDPILDSKELKELVQNKVVQIVMADLHSFSDSLNKLAQATPSCYVLTISLGIEFNLSQIIHGLGWLSLGAWSYGWKIHPFNNEGSKPGLGWYNTAALLHVDFIKVLQDKGLPKWVDNGVEGSINYEGKLIPIGGGEEIPMMHGALQAYPEAFFVLNIKEELRLEESVGTDIDFEEKRDRKIIVANYYLNKKLHIHADQLWKHLLIES